jgi:hypothetical protein
MNTRETLWRFARGLAVAAIVPVAACAGPQAGEPAPTQVGFNFRQYFDGTVVGHGLISDRGGKVLRRFVVTMRCEWTGDTGTLNEDFVYDDGERQHRVWQVRMHPDGRYTARAADVVGEARGGPEGPAFNWKYTLKLPVRGRVYEVNFDDWMYRIDERIVINKVVMTKFGIRVGELTLSFNRP